jgi:hypothetical protein
MASMLPTIWLIITRIASARRWSYPAVAHLGHEIKLTTLRVVDPQHVVKQQVVAIARSQALVRTARRTNHHLPESTDLRMHTECGFHE